MKPVGDMSLGQLAGYVCSHLGRNGIRVVLSGGAAVSIHSGSRYQSFDLDFVENVPSGRERLREVLKEIGFIEKAWYFVHSETEFFLDFPAGPLAVGREPVKDIEEMDFPTGKLNILSPTECVKDRLAAYYHWSDRQSLHQALLVAKCKPINLKEIARWSRVVGKGDEFEVVRESLLEAARRGKQAD